MTHVYTPDLERFTNVRSKFENTDTVSPLGPNHAWSTTARPLADITLLHMRDSVVDSFTNVTTGGYTGIAMNTVLWIVDVHLTGTAFNVVRGADTSRI